MAKPVEVYDEYDVVWFIFDGDPAAELVKPLVKIGLTITVFPRSTIKTGVLAPVARPDFDELFGREDLLDIPEVRDQAIRKLRMYEIYEYLK